MLPAKAEGHTRRARCQSWFYCILSFNPFILFTNSFSFVQNISKFNQVSSLSLHTFPGRAHIHLVVGEPAHYLFSLFSCEGEGQMIVQVIILKISFSHCCLASVTMANLPIVTMAKGILDWLHTFCKMIAD